MLPNNRLIQRRSHHCGQAAWARLESAQSCAQAVPKPNASICIEGFPIKRPLASATRVLVGRHVRPSCQPLSKSQPHCSPIEHETCAGYARKKDAQKHCKELPRTLIDEPAVVVGVGFCAVACSDKLDGRCTGWLASRIVSHAERLDPTNGLSEEVLFDEA